MKNLVKSILRCILKVFYVFPLKNNLIFILSFQGKSEYAFDGKAIVEYSNNKSLEYRFIWGYKGKKPINKHKNIKYVNVNSLIGIYYMLTCKTFITNINPISYIPYRNNQIMINTWHGFGPKKGGRFYPDFNEKQYNMSKCFLSANDIFTNVVLRDALMIKGKILQVGFCRNDILFDKEKVERIKNETKKMYGLSDKKIILYAPTFRGDFQEKESSIDFNKLIRYIENKTNKKWVVALRSHPMISSKMKNNNENIIDVSNHEDIHDLICMADVLISDYSSVLWDFSLTRKPVIIYADDLDEYKKDRSVFDFFYEFPFYIAKDMSELFEVVDNYNKEEYLNRLELFYKNCNSSENGKACEELFKYININLGGVK